jgi:ubiquinone/menaquinone biosynthesis C-methylase UbiE
MSSDDVQPAGDKTFWEGVAESRWGAYVSDIEERAILKAHDLCRKPATALEIGCEGGRWSKVLADLGWNMICTDINDQTLTICKKRIPQANCILVKPDDNELPCESESVALLLSIEVAPVIKADWFINEAFRVLQNGGLMVGVFFNLLSFRGLFAHTASLLTGTFGYYSLSYPSWRKKLLSNGYSVLYEEGYCWFPFRRASNSVFVPYFVRIEKELGLRKLVRISPWIVFIAQKASRGHLTSRRGYQAVPVSA